MAELVLGGGIADDGDDDGETSFICHRALERSSRPRSLELVRLTLRA